MTDAIYLLIKCTIAAGVMAIIHYISKSPNYYLSALALGFPAISMVAYFFMSIDRNNSDVRTTTFFAVFAAIPFIAFLGATNLFLKQFNIVISLAAGVVAWLLFTIILVIAWKHLH